MTENNWRPHEPCCHVDRRKVQLQRLRNVRKGLASRERRPARKCERLIDLEDALVVREEPVVAILVAHIQSDENDRGKPEGQTANIDCRVSTISKEISKRGGKIVAQHLVQASISATKRPSSI